MKKLILLTLLSLSTLLSTAGIGDTVIVGQSPYSVYIVMSPSAYAYHCFRDCRAIKQATHEIKRVTIDEAIRKYGRRACGYCYK